MLPANGHGCRRERIVEAEDALAFAQVQQSPVARLEVDEPQTPSGSITARATGIKGPSVAQSMNRTCARSSIMSGSFASGILMRCLPTPRAVARSSSPGRGEEAQPVDDLFRDPRPPAWVLRCQGQRALLGRSTIVSPAAVMSMSTRPRDGACQAKPARAHPTDTTEPPRHPSTVVARSAANSSPRSGGSAGQCSASVIRSCAAAVAKRWRCGQTECRARGRGGPHEQDPRRTCVVSSSKATQQARTQAVEFGAHASLMPGSSSMASS
jgi:hypothetical protein